MVDLDDLVSGVDLLALVSRRLRAGGRERESAAATQWLLLLSIKRAKNILLFHTNHRTTCIPGCALL